MLDLLKAFIDVLGKQIGWIVSGFLIGLIILISVTFAVPVSIDIYSCTQREDQYILDDTKYVAKSMIEKDGKATAKVCVIRTVKTVKTNLVEK